MNPQSAECHALLNVCTPSVYRNNAFRITGLTVDASNRDIKRRIDDLKHAEELGDAEDEHSHAYALTPTPSIAQIREAAQTLQDPERRIVEEFFWFWPLKWGESKSDPAISTMLNGDNTTAFNCWMEILNGHNVDANKGEKSLIRIRETDPNSIVVAKHNLAVMFHLVALDSEHNALESDYDKAVLDRISNYWRTSFKWWEQLSEDEIYWSLVTERIRMLDDPRLTTGFARRMRSTFPEALDKINAMLAISFAQRNKLSHAANHIQYMKETHQGQDNISKTLASVTQPLKTRVASTVERARSEVKRQPKNAAKLASELMQTVTEPLHIILMILPADDHERIDICDSVADTCLECQIAYTKETEDWSKGLEILNEALKFAASAGVKSRIVENHKIVSKNQQFSQHLDPLIKMIEKVKAKSTISAKLQNVENDLIPYVQKVKNTRGVTAELYGVCADMVAGYVRGISVDAWNEQKDIDLSARALSLAVGIVHGDEMRARLNQDRAQIEELQKQEKERKLYETCWFCKQNKATDAGVLETKMYGDVTRTPTFRGTQIQWRNITVKVPRCARCKEAHGKVGGMWAGAAAGAAAGTAFLPIVGTIIGAIAGGAIGSQVDQKMRLPPGVAAETTKRDFPLVREFISKGWEVGDKPT